MSQSAEDGMTVVLVARGEIGKNGSTQTRKGHREICSRQEMVRRENQVVVG